MKINSGQLVAVFIVGLLLILSGCATIIENMPGFTHTATLIIGESKNTLLSQAEHILVKPKQISYAFKGTSREVEIRRYTFTDVYDLVLYFYNDVFFQSDLIEPASDTYPHFREDYKSVHKGSPGPIGYILSYNGKTMSIDTLWRE